MLNTQAVSISNSIDILNNIFNSSGGAVINFNEKTITSTGANIIGGAIIGGGIDASGGKVFNVGDGIIAPGSTDDINGGQVDLIRSNLN